MNNPNEGPIDVPEHLKQALVIVLQEISIFIHKKSGASMAILNIEHLSDALNRRSNTKVSGMVSGEPVEPVKDESIQEQVDALVAQAMALAKQKERDNT